MKLITEEFIEVMKAYPLRSQEQAKDPLVPAKFFNPVGAQTWFILEYDPEAKVAFSYVTGMYGAEFGYVSIEELESVELPYWLTIERDLYFKPCRLSECTTFKSSNKENSNEYL